MRTPIEMHKENRITTSNTFLLVLPGTSTKMTAELDFLKANFCGKVVDNLLGLKLASNQIVYVCGDVSKLTDSEVELLVIRELSVNVDQIALNKVRVISMGTVPVLVSNVGVYFRSFFEGEDYFNKINAEHEFQELTESNKGSKALRTGIYLTNIERTATATTEEELHFRLLRCSSNLTGATDNFRATDREIITQLNEAASVVFEEETDLNHVLAQVYHNEHSFGVKAKETKAKIKAHSDKTKDMPEAGLIAFCTFYNESEFKELRPSKTDTYDWCYRETSGLTRLHFKLKPTVSDTSLEKEFSVVLYPNSAFIIPLSTNRLYTHEIRPSLLNIDRIPTRLGYVVRCSNAEVVYKNERVYLKEEGQLVVLEAMTSESMADLRSTYYKENKLESVVKYGKVNFSMNSGDYKKPIY